MNGTVRLKSMEDIRRIKECGLIIHEIFSSIKQKDLTGLTTWELDTVIESHILRRGARPAFKTVRGYDFSSCISVNTVASHGIPSKKTVIKNGDIVKIDTGTVLNGYFADSCVTVMVGPVEGELTRLMNVAFKAMLSGIEMMNPGKYSGDIGNAVESFVESQGCSVVRNYTGHGVGFALHEPPVIPNYGEKGQGVMLEEGMVVTCEPIVTLGKGELTILDDGWTSITVDGSLSAQYEHTVAITANGPVILTSP